MSMTYTTYLAELKQTLEIRADNPAERYSVSTKHFDKLSAFPDFPSKKFDLVFSEVKGKSPLTRKEENVVWPFISIYNGTDPVGYNGMYVIFFKFWNSHMYTFFPRGFDQTVFDITLSSLSGKFYLTKHGSISVMLSELAKAEFSRMKARLESGKSLDDVVYNAVIQARNKTRQIMRALANKYYETFNKMKNAKEKEEQNPGRDAEVGSVVGRLHTILTMFLSESGEFKKGLVTPVAKKLRVRPLYSFYALSTMTDADLPVIIALFERTLKDSSLTRDKMLYALAHKAEYQEYVRAFSEMTIDKIKRSAVVYNGFNKIGDKSKRNVVYVCILTLDLYIKKMATKNI